jgi:hypothetical protein
VDGRYSIVLHSSLAPSTSHAERCLALLDPGRTWSGALQYVTWPADHAADLRVSAEVACQRLTHRAYCRLVPSMPGVSFLPGRSGRSQ